MKRYIRKLKKYIAKHPEQFSLFLYNAGVFGWLQANVNSIVDVNNLQKHFPWVSPENIELAKSWVTTLPYGWLILSFLSILILRKFKRIVRRIGFLIVIVIGALLLYQYAVMNNFVRLMP